MPTNIATVGVMGAGQMGRGIAQVSAAAGLDVVLLDRERSLAEQGLGRVRTDLERLVERGKLDPAQKDAILSKIRVGDGYEALSKADIVIEAVTEDLALKTQIFASAARVMREEAVLASNTSSIPLTKLAASATRPERVIGMHFFNPVPVMKLVEIIRALQTNDETYKAVSDLAAKLGKTVVTARDMPGFIANRMLIPFLNEACFALQDNVGSVADIDTAAKLGFNHPMGPLELADLIGLDTCLFVSEVLHRDLGEDKYRPAPILRTYVAAGWLGRKSGRGFYDYSKK